MTLAISRRLPDEDRQAHILAAAERVFVRHGFHAATMSQVADEAGMSAGNLYRYFPSKEAIIEGLCLHEQVRRSEDFAALLNAEDLKSTMWEVLRAQVLDPSPEKARMIVAIWAEAGRNVRVAEFTRRLERNVRDGMVELIDLAKQRGAVSPVVDAPFAARVLFTMVGGLFKRKAMEPGFNVNEERAMMLGVFEALFTGALAPCAEA